MKLRTDLAHVGGLAEVDVDIGDLVILKKSEDVLSRAVGSCSGGSVGGDANPDSDGTDDRVLSLAFFVVLDDFLKTNDIDRCKMNLEILVNFIKTAITIIIATTTTIATAATTTMTAAQ